MKLVSRNETWFIICLKLLLGNQVCLVSAQGPDS